MTDRELLESVSAKLDALDARVSAVESAAEGYVSHDEVSAVVDKETSLEGRVSALESKFQITPPSADTTSVDTSTSGSGDGNSASVDSTAADDSAPVNHVIS